MAWREKEKLPDYYGLFQISPRASQIEIINAYRHAKLAYQADSLAVYSLYSSEELEDIQKEVEQAYQVLSDADRRREYDARCGHDKPDNGKAGEAGEENVVHLNRRISSDPVRLMSYRGDSLKRFREERGITLEEITERTKISRRYLQAIENEDRANFPEAVYLKGYLRQYCREIGVDPEQAVHMYIERVGSEE